MPTYTLNYLGFASSPSNVLLSFGVAESGHSCRAHEDRERCLDAEDGRGGVNCSDFAESAIKSSVARRSRRVTSAVTFEVGRSNAGWLQYYSGNLNGLGLVPHCETLSDNAL